MAVAVTGGDAPAPAEDARVVERARRVAKARNIADHEAPVTDAVGDEGLLAGRGVGVASVNQNEMRK